MRIAVLVSLFSSALAFACGGGVCAINVGSHGINNFNQFNAVDGRGRFIFDVGQIQGVSGFNNAIGVSPVTGEVFELGVNRSGVLVPIQRIGVRDNRGFFRPIVVESLSQLEVTNALLRFNGQLVGDQRGISQGTLNSIAFSDNNLNSVGLGRFGSTGLSGINRFGSSGFNQFNPFRRSFFDTFGTNGFRGVSANVFNFNRAIAFDAFNRSARLGFFNNNAFNTAFNSNFFNSSFNRSFNNFRSFNPSRRFISVGTDITTRGVNSPFFFNAGRKILF